MSEIKTNPPSSFWGYVRSMGPGLVAVLTWLGAGDIVNSATAGGNYGYALMWAFAACLALRYLFVSIIAKYQLLNPRGETALAGLTRLHRWYAPVVFVSTLALGHAVGAYMLLGIALAWTRLTEVGNERVWAILLSVVAATLTFRRDYRLLERVFFVLASVLTVSFLTQAAWVGPSWSGIAEGLLGFRVPATSGRFDAITVILALAGSVGGGLANLMHGYFIREKGWTTERHLRLQRYDLTFAILVMLVLDLSVWVVGAEVLHPRGLRIQGIEDLARLLGETLGVWGSKLFYLGLAAALFGPVVGNGAAYGYLATDAWEHWRGAVASTRVYRGVVLWTIFSPLIWVLSGYTDFVGLTLLVNAAQVVLLPLLTAGLWIITARGSFIGESHRNGWLENTLLCVVFGAGIVSTWVFLFGR